MKIMKITIHKFKNKTELTKTQTFKKQIVQRKKEKIEK